jgi:hypothetical protein
MSWGEKILGGGGLGVHNSRIEPFERRVVFIICTILKNHTKNTNPLSEILFFVRVVGVVYFPLKTNGKVVNPLFISRAMRNAVHFLPTAISVAARLS